MTDQPRPEETEPEEDLASEFRILGQTLMEAIRTAWERPERKRMQQEIENGLNEFGATLREEGETFRESPTGQRLKSELDQLQERIRSGEAEQRLRQDLLNALKTINAELKKAAERWSDENDQTSSSTESGSEPGGKEA